MLKKKNLKYLSMVLVLVMLITMVVITTLPKSSVEHNSLQLSSDTVSEDEKIANTTENLYPFTNFDSVDGISVDDYITYNYSNSVSVKYDAIKVKYKMTINGSDDIIKFVPEEMFKTAGFKRHFGKKYGFIVDTFKRKENDAFISTVMLVKITTSDDYMKNKSHLQIKVAPIFQADFAYVTRDNNKLFSLNAQYREIFKQEYSDDVILDYNCSGNEFIVPVPTHESGTLKFSQCNRLHLSDASNIVSLYNTNHYNSDDENYDPYKDYGCFFGQMDFGYDGNFLIRDSANYSEVGEIVVNGASTTFDFLDLTGALDPLKEIKFLKRAFKVIPAIGVAVSTIDIITDITKLATQAEFKKEEGKKNFTYQAHHTNRIDQIENGGLQKDAAIAIKINEPGKQFLVGVGNHFTFDYQLIKPENNDDVLWDNIYASMFTCGVYSVTTSGIANTKSDSRLLGHVTSVFSNELILSNDKEYKEVPQFDINKTTSYFSPVKVLPNRQNVAQINPEFSGNYDLKMGYNPYARFSVYECDKNDTITKDYNFSKVYANSTLVNGRAIIENINLNCNKSYVIVTDLQNNAKQDNILTRYDNLRLSVEYLAKDLQLGLNGLDLDNQEEIVTFSTENLMYFNLNVLSDNVENIQLLDNNLNVDNNYIFSNNKLQVAPSYRGKTLLFKIKLKPNMTNHIEILIDDEMYINFENIENINTPINKTVKITSADSYSLPVPQKPGYSFDGWWKEVGGNRYLVTNENLLSLSEPNLTLFAKWEIIEYVVHYVTNGGTAVEDMTYNIEYSLELNKTISRANYVFGGWFSNRNFTGERVLSVDKGSYGDKTFYAKWIKEQLQLTLDVNSKDTDGLIADISKLTYVVNYGKEYYLPVPKLDGFIFSGWFYGNKQLTYSNGRCLKPFEEEKDIRITAKWSREVFYFRVTGTSSTLWLTQNENDYVLSPYKNGIEFSYGMCPNCFIIEQLLQNNNNSELLRQRLFKLGHCYTHMSKDKDSNDSFCWKDMNAFHFFDSQKTFTIYPRYIKEKYHIYISKNGISQELFQVEFDELLYQNGTYLPQVTTTFEDTKTGYYLDGYEVANCLENRKFAGSSFEIGSVFRYSYMPDISYNSFTYDGNYSIYLTAHFSPRHYTVNFDNLQYPLDSFEVVYDGIYTYENALPVPEKDGYSFVGWRLGENGELISNNQAFIDRWQIDYDCVLFAEWTPKNHTIILNPNGGRVIGESKLIYNIEMDTFTLPTAKMSWYNFEGWSYNGNVITQIETGTFGDLELAAVWKKEKVNVIEFGTHNFTKNGLTVDFGLSGLLVAQTFVVEDTVDEIIFTGRLVTMSYKQILISSRNTPLTIKIKHFNVYSHYGMPAIDATHCSSLHLIVDGKNFLGSGNKTLTTVDNYSAAIMASSLSISGINNADLTLQGGAGVGFLEKNPNNNKTNGLSGADGIYCSSNLRIYDITLKATGGSGYAGYVNGDGGRGGNGINVGGRIEIYDSTVTAVAGNGGSAGQEGGSPGSAGTPVRAKEIYGYIERVYGNSGNYSIIEDDATSENYEINVLRQ